MTEANSSTLASPAATVDIRAQSARAARIMVQHRIGEALSNAGLARRAPDVLWVAPLDASHESSHRFMEQADSDRPARLGHPVR
jgi:hypothetical protein